MRYLTDGEREILAEQNWDAMPDPDEAWLPVEEIELSLAYLAQRYADELTGGCDDLAQVAAALRQPVSMASVLFDLATELDIICPDIIRVAIGEAA